MDGQKRSCRNCQAPLTGEYCSHCGQREGRRDVRFSDLAGELLGEFIDWDSRVWRTLLSLLFRPGFLTAEFMAGRRARYVPPLRLYLIISFFLFLTLSFSVGWDIQLVAPDEPAGGAAPSMEAGERAKEVLPGEGDIRATIELADEDSPAWLKELEERLETNVQNLEGDTDAFTEQFLEYVPQMMFLLLPVFAMLMRLTYLFSPFHYLQHLVFSLHYHSFAFLMYIVGQVVERVGWHWDGFLLLALFIYLPLAFRRSFDSGWFAALFKAAVVFIAYGVCLGLTFALGAVLAIALMD